MSDPINILAIPGSLRPGSSTSDILNNIAAMMPGDINLQVYDGLKALPAFDDSEEAPGTVIAMRRQLVDSDGILICTPEYAFGVPGILKNLLDWTVGSGELVNKPVAVITAATGGDKAHASLLLTLTALSADTSEETNLLIGFVRSKLGSNGEVSDQGTFVSIKKLVDFFLTKLSGLKSEAGQDL